MTDKFTVFRKLACSEMVRHALQNHPKHQPIAMDDRIDAQLKRLAEAEISQDRKHLRRLEGSDLQRQESLEQSS